MGRMAGAGTMNTARDGRIVAVNRLFSELLAHRIADLRDRQDWSGDEAGRCCRIKKNATLLVALFEPMPAAISGRTDKSEPVRSPAHRESTPRNIYP
jgi:hypothetical protein